MKPNVPYIVREPDFELFWLEFCILFPDCRLRRSKQEYLRKVVKDGYGLRVAKECGSVPYLNTTHGEVLYAGEVAWV